jgi:hypothetical protein
MVTRQVSASLRDMAFKLNMIMRSETVCSVYVQWNTVNEMLVWEQGEGENSEVPYSGTVVNMNQLQSLP